MDDINPAYVETSFAITKIVSPHAAKVLIEPQSLNMRPLSIEGLAPSPERSGVICPKLTATLPV
tara:strand:+ start:346 stop:537 length:192 start_codon:yes stop_codon:yes gene_type:complete